jgi:chromosome segregation ATPase
MTEGTTKEERSKYLKDLEKKKKKLSNDIESSENRISKSKQGIRNAQDAIPGKQANQKDVKARIDAQQAVVNKFQNKYNTIKGY